MCHPSLRVIDRLAPAIRIEAEDLAVRPRKGRLAGAAGGDSQQSEESHYGTHFDLHGGGVSLSRSNGRGAESGGWPIAGVEPAGVEPATVLGWTALGPGPAAGDCQAVGRMSDPRRFRGSG